MINFFLKFVDIEGWEVINYASNHGSIMEIDEEIRKKNIIKNLKRHKNYKKNVFNDLSNVDKVASVLFQIYEEEDINIWEHFNSPLMMNEWYEIVCDETKTAERNHYRECAEKILDLLDK